MRGYIIFLAFVSGFNLGANLAILLLWKREISK